MPTLEALLPSLVLSGLAATAYAGLFTLRSVRETTQQDLPAGRPFSPKTALLFVLVVGLALAISTALTNWLGNRGLLLATAVAGLADAHAAAISAASLAAGGKTEVPLAAVAVLVGFSTNSLSKAVVAFSLGDRRFAFELLPGLRADGAGCLGRMVREILARMTRQFARLARRFPAKRAFITGASSGLGLELARALGRDGWTLGLFDRNVERLAHVEEELSNAGLTVLAYPGDVTNADELTVAVNSFAATHDGLDVMVNNAGVAGSGTLMEVPLEDWRWIVDINFMGVVHGARAAIPHLQRNGSGLLINVASAAAFAAAPGMISYNATKAAVLSLSETLRGELRLDRHAGLGRDADLLQDQPARIVSRARQPRASRRRS